MNVPELPIANSGDTRPWFELLPEHSPYCPCHTGEWRPRVVAMAWQSGDPVYRPSDFDTAPYSARRHRATTNRR